MNKNEYLVLTGQTEDHLINYDEQFLIHKDVLKPFKELQEKIYQDKKLKLEILSSFRSFDRQKFIWNQKCTGQRPVLDNNNNPIDIEKQDPYALVCSILRWSALPGFSRHHWGTDLDIFDESNKPEHIELVPEEYAKGGPFYEVSNYLDQLIADNNSFQFYRPYQKDLGGVGVEPWHLSYKPLAKQYQEMISLKVFEDIIHQAEFNNIELIGSVRENAEEVFYRFISL